MTPDEALLQDKMAQIIESGKSLHVETAALMTDEDRRLLRSSRYQQMAMYHFFGILLTGFVFIPAVDSPILPVQIAIAVAVFMAYYTLLLVLYKRMTRMYAGQKRVVKGLITARWIGNSRTGYGLTVGTEEIEVPIEVYRQYRIGDAVELHQFTGWGIFLVQHRVLDASSKSMFLDLMG